MEVYARKQEDSVLCELADGGLIEITMLSTQGDEVQTVVDIKEAVNLLQRNPQLLKLKA